MRRFYIIIVWLLGFVLHANAFNAIESYQNQLQGRIKKGDTLIIKDEKFQNNAFDWTKIHNRTVSNILTFGLFRDSGFVFTKSFKCQVELKVEYWSQPDQADPVIVDHVKLNIGYDSIPGAAYQAAATYRFMNGYKVKITVNDISSAELGTALPAAFSLSGQVVIERSYDIAEDNTIVPTVTLVGTATAANPGVAARAATTVTANDVSLTWGKITGAEEYDLEWTFIDEESANGALLTQAGAGVTTTMLERMFRNNATRVTVPHEYYDISLVNFSKYLLIRIRTVQYTADGFRQTGAWNYDVSQNEVSGIGVITLDANASWHLPLLNWQYSAVYAEEGKKKEIVSYFDGTLRSRQTVTVNNSDNKAIVQESLYDEFGRPLINILPVPLWDNKLTYYPGLHINSSGSTYNFTNAYGAGTDCINKPQPLKTDTGAAKYYSPNNSFLIDEQNKYIPDAAGYPFSAMVYTTDNTNRPKVQGGVGELFQPGPDATTSKATRYYYDKPQQWELDRMFGNDAGYASHYLKNMVIDGNGQISVSYQNTSGKTVATALAGDAPANTDALASKPLPVTETFLILQPDDFNFDNSKLKLSATTTYTCAVPGTVNLSYTVDQLIKTYSQNGVTICSNCYYELKVRITDDCNRVIYANTTPVPVGSLTSNCGNTAAATGAADLNFDKIGEYYISLEFGITEAAIQNYTDDFVKRNTNLSTQWQYIQNALWGSDFSTCFSECTTCKASLGERVDFIARVKGRLSDNGVDITTNATAINSWADSLYTSLSAQCLAARATCGPSPCQDLEDQMKMDVSPGGQYALFDTSNMALEQPINVIYLHWRDAFPVKASSDADYISAQFEDENNVLKSPYDQTFTLKDLVKYWKSEWASKFISYHPEYCALQFCNANSSYLKWDDNMVNLAATVSDIPALASNVTYSNSNAAWLVAGDPFFAGAGSNYKVEFTAALNNYSKTVLAIAQVSVKSLSAYVDYSLYCSDTTGNTNSTVNVNHWNNCTPVVSCRIADLEWRLYRDKYMELKNKYYQRFRDSAYCGSLCPVGSAISYDTSSCPSIQSFAIQSDTTNCGIRKQSIKITYTGASPLTKSATVSFYYPQELDLVAKPANVIFAAGQTDVYVCIDSVINTESILIAGVKCGTTSGGSTFDCSQITTANFQKTFSYDGTNTNFTITYTGPAMPAGYSISLRETFSESGAGAPNTDVVAFTSSAPTVTFARHGNVTSWVITVVSCGGAVGSDFCSQAANTSNFRMTSSHVWNGTNDVGNNWTYTLTYIGGTAIPVGGSMSVSVLFEFPAIGTISTKQFYFDHDHSSYSYTLPGNANNQYTYTINTSVSCSVSSTPPVYACDQAYKYKVSRIDKISYAAPAVSSDTAVLRAYVNAQIAAQIGANCEAQADTWMQQLDDCLQSNPTYLSNKDVLRATLISICKRGGDVDHPNGAITVPVSRQVVGQYSSFKDAIKGVLGVSTFNMICNPWLIDAPYPYDVKEQAASHIIEKTSADVCSKLATITSDYTASGSSLSLYQYMVNKYGATMNLSAAEFTSLQNGCTNCRYLLAQSIQVPVFLDGTAKGCVTATEFQAGLTAMATEITLTTTDANYEGVYSTYLNQRWGFTLSYGDYKAYVDLLVTTPTAILCNHPAYSTVKPDPYACMMQVMDNAIATGIFLYREYITEVRRQFRKDYIAYCSAPKPKLQMIAAQQYYHFTLYYYDQAGNLVRTVPPEGVHLLDASYQGQITDARKIQNTGCSYDDAVVNKDKPTALQQLTTMLQTTTNSSMEMWMYSATPGTGQVLVTTGGNKFLMNTCVDGRYLHLDTYTLTPAADNLSVDMTVSTHTAVDMQAVLPLKPWTHIVMQSSAGLNSDNLTVYVNGVACPAAATSAPNGSCGFDLTATSSGIVYPESITSLKHLRLYNKLLSASEIAANAGVPCLSLSAPALANNLQYWGRFNIPDPSATTTIGDGSTTESQYAPVYPSHTLPTSYAYQSLNGLEIEFTPDNTGNSRYWYDRLGRVVFSNNWEQYTPVNGGVANRYSYTNYDGQGRIIEVGEKSGTNSLSSSTPFLTDAQVSTMNTTGTNTQITRTSYDEPYTTAGLSQENLRKRVSAVTYQDVATGGPQQATYYSYDQLGNVKTLWQQVLDLGVKRVDYQYDLVSGKVNKVRYQQGAADRFYYNYEYDAENRLTKASTGINSTSADAWGIENPKTDAAYRYYLHGPLARMELGNTALVQGLDYAYTLQGWLKGVNGNYLSAANDMGKDGVVGGTRAVVGRDAYAYTLDYFNGDYQPIGTGQTAIALKWGAQSGDVMGRNLYNGNISRSTLALSNINSGASVGYTYRYDQLNRLTAMRQHGLTAGATDWNTTSIGFPFKEDVKYDGNGNILSYVRYGSGASGKALPMDSMNYVYTKDASGYLKNNRLTQVLDRVSGDPYTGDISNQAVNNYLYDNIGNLIKDVEGGVSNIQWTVYGKIKSITKSDGSSLEYRYDAGGNRIYKAYTHSGVTDKAWYVRDAQGNALAIYGNKDGGSTLYWKEQELYGSSRLGIWTPDVAVGTDVNTIWNNLGVKRYELSNHLGNVLATISDKPVLEGDHYKAELLSAQDYYPFGMLQPDRSYSLGSYRYGFNGKENDNEVKGEGNQQDYGMRIYDPRLGRFLSVDPLASQFADQGTFNFAIDNPITFIDFAGGSGELPDPPTKTRSYIRVKYKTEIPTQSLKQGQQPSKFVTFASRGFQLFKMVAGSSSVIRNILKPANGDYAGPGASDGNELSFQNSLHPERITTNPQKDLTDEEKNAILDRINRGVATQNDWLYQKIITPRHANVFNTGGSMGIMNDRGIMTVEYKSSKTGSLSGAFVSESGFTVMFDAQFSIEGKTIDLSKVGIYIDHPEHFDRKSAKGLIKNSDILKLKSEVIGAIENAGFKPGDVEYYRRATEDEKKEGKKDGEMKRVSLKK